MFIYPKRILILGIALVLGALLATKLTTGTARAASCTLYASPSGSDSTGNGSITKPFLTVSKLEDSLTARQSGCLRAGTYGSVSTVTRFDASGSASGQITITAAPGEHAKLAGLIEVEANYVTLSRLEIDGSNNAYNAQRSGTTCTYPISNGLELDGKYIVFEHNDFYQSVASMRGNGIGVGWNHPADGTIIRNNRIHDVGLCGDYDHAIYLAAGNGVQVYDNWLWNDPAGWGIQVYPTASNAKIYSNVIDTTGSGVLIATSGAGNSFTHNIVVNSTGIHNKDQNYSAPGVLSDCFDGTGNVVQNNDSYNNPGGIGSGCNGVTVSGNITSNPQFTNATAHDYRLIAASPAASWGTWDGDLGSLTSTTTTTTTTATPKTTTATTTPKVANHRAGRSLAARTVKRTTLTPSLPERRRRPSGRGRRVPGATRPGIARWRSN